MLKLKQTLLLFMGWFPMMVFSQSSIAGYVQDEQGESVVGVHVEYLPSGELAITNEAGYFVIENISSSEGQLKFSHVGYQSQVYPIKQNNFIYTLSLSSYITDQIVVKGLRATENTGTTYQNIDKAAIEERNTGQDLPYLLDMTPSMVVSSDAGHGIGYTGMRIRGSDGTRINATINGIPLNNAESHGAFWINLPDLASSIESIQIQRGVGTSTNGAGSFGASLNISTNTLRTEPYIRLNNSFGSFNSRKHTVAVGSGLIKDQFTLDMRLSKVNSDGFIDRAFSDLGALYVSGGWYTEDQILRFNIISGKEKTYQAWNGVPSGILQKNRTYNQFTYENQTDNYWQSHYQLHYTRQFNPNWNWNISFNYTPGKGYYEEYKEEQSFSNYGMQPIFIRDSVLDTTDLIRRLWLDNQFYGFTTHSDWTFDSGLSMIIGGGFFRYDGDHFGEVIWAEYASNLGNYDRYYFNNALKNDGNIYLKFNQNWEKTNFYLDLQMRNIDYSFLGYNRNSESVEQNVSLVFFNPKIGFTYQQNPQLQWYASLAKATREPNRKDYTESTPDSRPNPEKLYDFEGGLRWNKQQWAIESNLYFMYYEDQLVLTGEINDVGGYIRDNVDQSYRLGWELNGQVALNSKWQLMANAGISQNKISEYQQFLDIYDESSQYLGQQKTDYSNTDIAFSPNFVGGLSLNYKPIKPVNVRWESKFVSKQYLDNTQNEERSIDPYSFTNLRLDYTILPKSMKKVILALNLNNIFDTKYETNGYTYGYFNQTGQREDTNVYYPQAGFHFMFSLNMEI